MDSDIPCFETCDSDEDFEFTRCGQDILGDEPQWRRQSFEIESVENIEEMEVDDLSEGLKGEEEEEDEEVEEGDEEAEYLWSIDDDTFFYPLGFISHAVASKSVFVTWSENYLLNFVFKKSKISSGINLKKVNVPIPKGEIIQKILILELNTLLLMRSGHVYCFGSMKSVHIVPWLHGIRCISTADGGFSVIRMLSNNTLKLEVYYDVVDLAKKESTFLQHWDITFDDLNMFNCHWQDEHFTLVSYTVASDNMEFMQALCRVMELNEGQQVHIFTVSGNAFALVPGISDEDDTDTEACDIIPLNSYATTIEFIKVHFVLQLCVVLLRNGIIEFWYMSSIGRTMQRQSYQMGMEYTQYDYNETNSFLYVTDEDKVAQFRFKYCRILDEYVVFESIKAIPGIVVCTWAESLQQLVCISCNNIFYKLIFEADDAIPIENVDSEFENLNELYELTPEKFVKLLEKSEVVSELAQVPKQLNEEIEEAFLNQQLMSVAEKIDTYKRLFKARLVFSTQVPVHFQEETIVLHANATLVNNNSLYALIYLKLTRNYIFNFSNWYLNIDYDRTAYNFNIPKPLFNKNLCIVISLARNTAKLLPEFQLKLLTFIANNGDFLAVLLPIELLVTSQTYNKLFSLTKCISSISDLIAKVHKESNEKNVTLLMHTLNLTKAYNFNDIFNIFQEGRATKKLELYFMSSKVIILYNKEANSITIESTDAAAVYYLKLHMYKNLQAKAKIVNDHDKLATRHLLTCNVEQCFGQLIQSDEYNTHSEKLKRIYAKIRSDLGNSFMYNW